MPLIFILSFGDHLVSKSEFAWVEFETNHFWDGGIVSNTPLQHLLDQDDELNTLVFQVDLFSARGVLPRDIQDVVARHKDIVYSSCTRYTTDVYRRIHNLKMLLAKALAQVPPNQLSDQDRKRDGPTPSGLVYYLPNPARDGDPVSYDDCQKATGFEFKGEQYTWLLMAPRIKTSITAQFLAQSASQIAAGWGAADRVDQVSMKVGARGRGESRRACRLQSTKRETARSR